MSINAADQVPDKLTDEAARQILTATAPRAREVAEKISRSNIRAEQGAEALKALSAKAKAAFETDDVGEMRAILDRNLIANSEAVKAYLRGLAEREQAIEVLSKSAPGR